MKKQFSAYEFSGIIVPGATFLFGLAAINRPVASFLTGEDFDVGELGLVVIACYVGGHLLQGFGNLVEKTIWAFRGMPTSWIRKAKPPFLSDAQSQVLKPALARLLGHTIPDLQTLDARACDGIRGQLYARLLSAKRTERIDAFNGNYGMFRGVVTACLLILIINSLKSGLWNQTNLGLLVLGFVAQMRMQRFGVIYAAELFRQALDLDRENTDNQGGDS